MDYQSILVSNILSRMSELHMTKMDLAKASGLAYVTVSKLLINEFNPSLKVMASIADALQIPLALLLSDKNDPDSLEPNVKIAPGFAYVHAILPDFYAYKANLLHQKFLSRSIIKSNEDKKV